MCSQECPSWAPFKPARFTPPNWCFAIFSPGVALNVVVISTYHLALIGSYLFGRYLGLTRPGSLVTAVTFTFGSFLIAQYDQTNFIAALVWLPWILSAIERLRQRPSWKWVTLGAIFIALQTYAGLPQASLLTALVVAPYILFCLFVLVSGKQRRRFAIALGWMVGCGILLAAMQLLPARELQLQGERAQLGYEYFSHWSMPPRHLWALVFPNFFGGGLDPFYRLPRWDSIWLVRWAHGYVGMLGLLLAFVAIAGSLQRKSGREPANSAGAAQTGKPQAENETDKSETYLVWFWLCLAVMALVLAFGHYLPFGLNHALYRVPIYNLFRGSFRHLFEYSFAVAVLAGLGTDVLVRRNWKQARRALLTGLVILSALVMGAGIVYLFFAGSLPVENSSAVPARSLTDAEILIPSLFFLLSIGAAYLFAKRRTWLSSALLPAVLLSDLWAWGYCTEWRTVGWEAMDTFLDSPAVTFVKQREPGLETFRILSHSAGEYALNCGEVNCQNMSIARGLQSAGGYDPMRLSRVAAVAGKMSILGRVSEAEAFGLSDRGLDLLNVKYLLYEKPPATNESGSFSIMREGIPFKQTASTFQLTSGSRREFEANGFTASDLGIVSTMSNSAHIADGIPVARIKLHLKDGRVIEREIQAGRDTAEWAWERDDVRPIIKHQRARVAESWDAGGFQGHRYLARFSLEPAPIEFVEFEYVDPDSELMIERASLLNSQNGNAMSLDLERLPSARWRKLARFGAVEVFENLNFLPRAWFVTKTVTLSDAEALQVIKKGRFNDGSQFDPASVALVESEPLSTTSPLDGASEKATVEVVSYEPDRITLRAKNKHPGFLVLSEVFYPGWQAFVDGTRFDIQRTNFVLRGLSLPPGDHLVEFRFHPQSLFWGSSCAAIGALLLSVNAILAKRKGK